MAVLVALTALILGPAFAPTASRAASRPPRPSGEAWLEALPVDFTASVRIGQLTYRGIEISDAEVTVKGGRARLVVEIETMSISNGTLNGELNLDIAGGRRNYVWSASGERIDFGPIAATMQPELGGTIDGALTFSAQGTMGAAAERNEATLSFDLSDGTIMRSRLLDFIAEKTRADIFRRIRFTTFHGDVTLKRRQALLNQVWLRGPAVQLLFQGMISLDGEMDVSIQPGIGSSEIGRLADNALIKLFRWPFSRLLDETEGYLSFPVVIRARGDLRRPAYSAQPKLPRAVGASPEFVRKRLEESLRKLIGPSSGDAG